MSTSFPYAQPRVQEVKWQGPELALTQLENFLDIIKGALQPPRADIISAAAIDGLKVVALLEDYIHSRPPIER